MPVRPVCLRRRARVRRSPGRLRTAIRPPDDLPGFEEEALAASGRAAILQTGSCSIPTEAENMPSPRHLTRRGYRDERPAGPHSATADGHRPDRDARAGPRYPGAHVQRGQPRPQPSVLHEAERCLQCKKPTCMEGCPVRVNIPRFIELVAEGDLRGAAESLLGDNALPASPAASAPRRASAKAAACVAKG